ncbi:MAG: LON peptidase substrate-binding domain-containing protein [Methyloglobulus sp.]|nr:hypothetical protein [Methyloglobulus sp.]
MAKHTKLEISPADLIIPVLPLRDVVVYPHMEIPLFVGREKSIVALDAAMREDKQVLLVTQKQAEIDDPEFADLYSTGTLANIIQMSELPEDAVKVLVEGSERCRVDSYIESEGYFAARVRIVTDEITLTQQEQKVLRRTLISCFDQYVTLNSKVPPEVLNSLAGINDLSCLVDTIAAGMALKIEDQQSLLDMANVAERLEALMTLMKGEVDLLEIEKN